MSTLITPQDLLALRAQGLTLRQISIQTGLALSTVSKWLRLDVAKPRRAPGGKQRKCLCCENTFWSQSANNRLCNHCRRLSAGPMDTPFNVSV